MGKLRKPTSDDLPEAAQSKGEPQVTKKARRKSGSCPQCCSTSGLKKNRQRTGNATCLLTQFWKLRVQFILWPNAEGVLAALTDNPVGPEFVSRFGCHQTSRCTSMSCLHSQGHLLTKWNFTLSQTSKTYDLNICQSHSTYLQHLNSPPPRSFPKIPSGWNSDVLLQSDLFLFI